jgi:hypothetical protein
MAKSHADLYKELHFHVLEVGSSHNRAMNLVNSRIDTDGLDIVKLNNQNMSVHFSSHIMLTDKTPGQTGNYLAPGQSKLSEINSEVSGYVEDIVRRKVGNEINDYLNLDYLRAQLMDKLEFLDQIVTKETEDGKKFVDIETLDRYVSVVKEIRACIIDLNKIRQSKQLMNVIIRSLIEKNTFAIVQQLSKEYDTTKAAMVAAGVPEDVATRLDLSQRIRLAEVVATTARAAVEEVTKAYKLG